MKSILTVSCKLQPTPEQVAKIEATLKAFRDACNYINQVVDPKMTNSVRIQTLVYEDIRVKFRLSANLAVRAINRVAGNRKTAKQQGEQVKAFKPNSADYDARIFAYREKEQSVSLTLVGGREHIKMKLANYQIGKLKGRTPTSATLFKSRKGEYYINIQIKDEAPEPTPIEKVLGVDLGRTDICVTSEEEKFSGKQITEIRNHYAKLRASIQQKASKGTRSTRRNCRRLLKRLSGKEKRFQRHVNHVISKHLVSRALVANAAIALEDLSGIRTRTNAQPRSKKERRLSNSWAFFNLRIFIAYKALAAGVEVVFVPPAYTSQSCHQCGVIGDRSGKSFKCVSPRCLWHGDSDLNGAVNISKLGGVNVCLPESSVLACSLNSKPQTRAEAPCL